MMDTCTCGPVRGPARSGGSGHNPDVTLAACTARGAVTGPPRRAHARIVPAGERPEVWNTFRAKYRVQLQAILLTERITKMVRRRSGQPGERVYLKLTLATPEDTAPSSNPPRKA